MRNQIASALRQLNLVYRKRLPREFGSGKIYVTPNADMRVIYPGWARAAPDLKVVATNYVDRSSVVWDVGSNLGIFSALAAHKCDAVFSVEADPAYAALQTRSFSKLRVGYSRVEVLCAAISDRAGFAEFSISGAGGARSSLTNVRDLKRTSRIRVVTTTLDKLLDVWPAPTMVKLDVEGAETLALRGATKLLTQVRPKLYVEVSPENSREVTELFKTYQYQLFKLQVNREPSPIRLAEMYTIALPTA